MLYLGFEIKSPLLIRFFGEAKCMQFHNLNFKQGEANKKRVTGHRRPRQKATLIEAGQEGEEKNDKIFS